jgi:phosphodiester glycosidase
MPRWLALLIVVGCGHSDARSDRPTPSPPPAASPPPPATTCESPAVEVGHGVVAERHAIGATPLAGEACLDVVRVDLGVDRARLLTAAHDDGARPLPSWRDDFHLAAAINAGMFQGDGSPVGFMSIDGKPVSADNVKMSGYIAFDPRNATDPPAAIAGRGCPGFDLAALRARYRTILQSYRLLGCDGAALPWADAKHYSAVAIGLDRKGRAVLVHARAALTMTELARELGALDLTGALFLEGGPEATLVAGSLVRVGSYETAFNENDDNTEPWKLPLVIGFARR